MLENLTGVIIHLIQSSGYLGIGFLMTLNSSAIPIPSEVILPFAGFLASQSSLSLILVIIAGIIGDLIGSLIGYGIGYFLEENLLLSLIKKYGKIILVTEHDYHKATSWIKKYGSMVVFLGKMTPGIKSFISIAAGITEIKLAKFIVANLMASIIYVTFVSSIGFLLGENWGTIGAYFRKFEIVIVIALIIAVAFYINYKLKIIKLNRTF